MRNPIASKMAGPLRALVLVILLTLITSQGALAHASLVRADPAPGASLADAPSRVTLWFAEPVEPKFSEIKVLDSTGNQVDNGDTAPLESDPKAISVSLKPLDQGLYTVVWRNVSALDGHPLMDRYTFAVGQAVAPGQPSAEQTLSFGSPLDPILRWLSLLGALTLVGGFGFYLLVAAPGLRDQPDLLSRIAKRVHALQWAALALLALAEIGRLLVQASVLYGVEPYEALGAPASGVLTNTEWGTLWLWRIALVSLTAIIMAISAFAARQEAARDTGRWLALATGAMALATFSLSSHGSAVSGLRVPGAITDYLHLIAAAFWVGGLFHLLLGISVFYAIHPMDRQAILPGVIPRFSTVAMLSVGVLIVTGAYGAWAMAGTAPPAYTGTPYGQSLVAKVALFAGILLLAAANLFWVTQRLSFGPTWRWLRRLVAVEAMLAILALLAAGFLTTLEPARPVAAREGLDRPLAQTFHITTQDKHVTLIVDPGRVGNNRVSVLVSDWVGNPVNDADVSIRLSYIGADLGSSDLSAQPEGDGAYSLEDVPMDIAGQWQIDLTIRSRGSFDLRTSNKLDVSDDASSGSGIAPQNTGMLLFAVELLLLGFLVQGTGIRIGGWQDRLGAIAIGAGSLLAISGIVLVLGVLVTAGGG